jgi:predicted  nucleic acid-binding Zn-ribbon protein
VQEREGAKETAVLITALEEERRVLSDALEYRSTEVSQLRLALEDHRKQLLECRDALREAREDIDGPQSVIRLGSGSKESADEGGVFTNRGDMHAGHRAGHGSGNQIAPRGRSGDSNGVDAAAFKELRGELASLSKARAEAERALQDAEGRQRLAERAMQDARAETGKNGNCLFSPRLFPTVLAAVSMRFSATF